MTDALARVTLRVAEEVPCERAGVWCTFQELAAETVGGRAVDGDGRIVYVDVWMRPRDDVDAPGRALSAACHAVAEGLGVPLEDVWGALHDVEPGRVFAGGELIR